MPSSSTFELTPEKVAQMNHMSAGVAMASFLLCALILVASWVVWKSPRAKGTLNRVSFRLLLWTMAAELVYDIAYTLTVLIPRNAPGAVCTVGVFGMMTMIGVTNYLVTCVGLNLCLVLVFGVKTKPFEKYYVILSFVLGIFIPVVPASLGYFGWDPALDVCWIRANDQKARIKLFILSLYLWQLLSCLVSFIAVGLTIIYLYRQSNTAKTHLTSLSTAPSSNAHPTAVQVGSQIQAIAEDQIPAAPVTRPRRGSVSTSTFHNRFLSVATRVALYPIALIIVNVIITWGDLQISVNGGVDSPGMYALYVIYYFFYGARGGVFACIALFVDPSLTRGLRLLFKTWRDGFVTKSTTDLGSSSGGPRTTVGSTWQNWTRPANPTATTVMVTVELEEFTTTADTKDGENIHTVTAGDVDHKDDDDDEQGDIAFQWARTGKDLEDGVQQASEGNRGQVLGNDARSKADRRRRQREAKAAYEDAAAQL